jgi:hypothetical protein
MGRYVTFGRRVLIGCSVALVACCVGCETKSTTGSRKVNPQSITQNRVTGTGTQTAGVSVKQQRLAELHRDRQQAVQYWLESKRNLVHWEHEDEKYKHLGIGSARLWETQARQELAVIDAEIRHWQTQ